MDFLDTYFLDNAVKSYLLVAGIILLVILLKRFLSHYVASLIYVFIKAHWKTIEKKQFVILIVKPLGWFLAVIISIFALDKLSYPSAWQFSIYGHPLEGIIEKTGVCIIIYSFIRLLLSLINFIALLLGEKTAATKDKNDDQLVVFFRDFLRVIIIIIGILLLLRAAFNQDIGRLLTGLSIVGAALALSAKESLENLIASFVIFFDKPFHVGDTLKVNAVTGTVERIGLRSTRIRTTDKTLVTVPNKQMVDSIVDNYTMRSQRRAEIKLELDITTSSEKLQPFMEAVKEILLGENKEIIKSSVFISEISKNGITLILEYFTIPFTMGEYNKLKQNVNLHIKTIMEEQEIIFSSSAGSINIFNSDADAGAAKPNPII
ncbi:MAG: mechanosensitive ion channel family protein [Ferruginibacter sp.]